MGNKKLSFTEKTVIDIVSKNIVDESLSGRLVYLEKRGGRIDVSVCGISFRSHSISFSGPQQVVEKIGEDCKLPTMLIGQFHIVRIPIKMFPTLALLSKVSKGRNIEG